jgi:branched-chain amino acid transport system substrate-binding protein
MIGRVARALAISLFLLAAPGTWSQDATATVTLNWSAVDGAGAYRVEIRNADGDVIIAERVAEPQIQLEVLPGEYKMRVTALNRFMQDSGSTDWMPFSVLRRKPPVVSSISPRSLVPDEGGTLVLRGEEFGEDTSVVIGDGSSTPLLGELVSAEEMRVRVPPIDAIGTYDLVLTNKPDLSVSVRDAFSIRYPEPVAELLKPSALDFEAKDRQVTVGGGAFYEGIEAALVQGNRKIALTAERTSLTALQFLVPAGIAPGSWDLELANDPTSVSIAPGALVVVFAAPVSASVEPSVLDFDTSDRGVVATGNSFYSTVSAALVKDGDRITLDSSRVSPTELHFRVPADLAVGNWDLELANGAEATAILRSALAIVPSVPFPVPRRVIPQIATSGAAERLTLHGEGFTPQSRLLVAGRDPALLVYRSSTELEFVPPVVAVSGYYALSLENRPDRTGALDQAFYLKHPDPVLNSVEPGFIANVSLDRKITVAASAVIEGATVELVDRSGDSFRLGGLAYGSSSVSGTVPADVPLGLFDLVVTNGPYSQGQLLSALRIGNPSPMPLSASPASLEFDDAERTIAVAGSYFISDATVELVSGAVAVGVEVLSVSDDLLLFFAPHGLAEGEWGVQIRNDEWTSGRLSSALTVVPAVPFPTLTEVVPSRIDPAQTATIVLTGSGFLEDTKAQLGDGTKLETRFISADRLECVMPALDPGPPITIIVVNRKERTASLPDAVQVRHEPPVIRNVSPATIETDAVDHRVTIEGESFSAGAAPYLVQEGAEFGLEVVERHAGNIVVNLPADMAPGLYELKVVNDEWSGVRLVSALTVVPAIPYPTIDAIEPSRIDPETATVITISGSGFLEDTRVELSDGTMLETSFVSSDTLKCLVPARGTGEPISVVVVNTEMRMASLPDAIQVRSEKMVRIGAILAITGGGSFLGVPQRNTLIMLVDDINSSGGIDGARVDLVVRDSATNPDKAIGFAHELIEIENVIAIIGPSTSGETLRIKDYCDGAGTPLVSMAASEEIVAPVAPYVFKTAPSDDITVERVFKTMNDMRIYDIGVIGPDSGFGNFGIGRLRELAPEYGIRILFEEKYEPNASDLTDLLAGIDSRRLDAVINWSIDSSQSTVSRNMGDLGVSLPLFQSYGFGDVRHLAAAGDSAEGTMFPSGKILVAEHLPDEDRQKPVLIQYARDYRERYGESPSVFGGHAHDAFMIVVEALKRGGADRAKVRDEIEGLSAFAGVGGVFHMSPSDHNGLGMDSITMVTVENGEFASLEVDAANVVSPGAPIYDEIFVQGGTFQMGSEDATDPPANSVSVLSFWMMKTEVTQGDFIAVAGYLPHGFEGDRLPVSGLSWYQAVSYANVLSEHDGLARAYTIDGTSVSCNWSADGWRLPTEAEWEYAARGGALSIESSFAGSNVPGNVAWYAGNSNAGNTGDDRRVGMKGANELGLYDLSGNVWEWCWDSHRDYAEAYYQPQDVIEGNENRERRGGSVLSFENDLRVMSRSNVSPSGNVHGHVGFRLVRAATSASSAWAASAPSVESVSGVTDTSIISKEVYVQGATFMMGSQTGDDDPKPGHMVTLSSFWMGATEVTQGMYEDIMGSNPSYFTSGNEAPFRPVEQVSWYDALVFCNRLSIHEGLTPVYSISDSTDPDRWGSVPTTGSSTWDSVVMDREAEGYRLPTEAEWEFSAQGGTAGKGYTFSGGDDIDEVAWMSDNSGDITQPVGQKKANELSLFDMSGSVREWCWDLYGSYPSDVQYNPTGVSSGALRVRRDFAWDSVAEKRVDSTVGLDGNRPNYRYRNLGFRVVRNHVTGQGDDESRELVIRAYIDGMSRLYIRDNSVWWHHFTHHLPGYHPTSKTEPPSPEDMEPTYINGKAWMPIWPCPPDGKEECISSKYDLSLSDSDFSKTERSPNLTIVRSRDRTIVNTLPSAGNDYLTVIELNDNASSGAEWYEIILSFDLSDEEIGQQESDRRYYFNPDNRNFYKVVNVEAGIDWETAKAAAEASSYLGAKGHLATITSNAEAAFVDDAIRNEESLYDCIIGARFTPGARSEANGTWHWVTGEPFVYTNWNTNEPNNGNNGKIIEFHGSGWNDAHLQEGPIDGRWKTYLVEFETTMRIGLFAKYYSVGLYGDEKGDHTTSIAEAEFLFDKVEPSIPFSTSFWPIGFDHAFAVEFSGYLRIDEDDDYRFSSSSDDELFLYLDERLVLKSDASHDVESEYLRLEPGVYPVLIHFFGNGDIVREHGGNGSRIQVTWEKGTGGFSEINTERLFPAIPEDGLSVEPMGAATPEKDVRPRIPAFKLRRFTNGMSINVAGKSCLFMAGRLHSTSPRGVRIAGLKTLFIHATGMAAADPGPEYGSGPDGNILQLERFPGDESATQFGISSLSAPWESLIGVFLADEYPDPSLAPEGLTILSAAETVVNPKLHQSFFVGSGPTEFIVPEGATRLYFGLNDGSEWDNNRGSFLVTLMNTAPTGVQVSESDVAQGLIGDYYTYGEYGDGIYDSPGKGDAEAGVYQFTRIDTTISDEQFWPFGFDHAFFVEWNGLLSVQRSGSHKFEINADNDAYLYIDGELAISCEDIRFAGESDEMYLEKGFHTIRILFFSDGDRQELGNAGYFKLRWWKPTSWFRLKSSVSPNLYHRNSEERLINGGITVHYSEP